MCVYVYISPLKRPALTDNLPNFTVMWKYESCSMFAKQQVTLHVNITVM